MTKKPKQLIAISVPISISAATPEATGPRTFAVTAYTGGALTLGGWDLPVVVDLKGLKSSNSLIANLDHVQSQRVGHVTDKMNDGMTLKLSGIVSAATHAADEVVASADKGFTWQASIEATPTKIVEIEAGKTTTVNGQTFDGPLYLVRSSTLKGFAFVSHGADDNTTAIIAAHADNSKETLKVKPEIKAWAESMGFDPDTATPEQIAAIEANYAGTLAKTKKVTKPADVFAAYKADAEREERIAEILERDLVGRSSEEQEAIHKLYDLALEQKWEAKDFELELFRACRPQARAVFRGRRQEEKLSAHVLEAAICQTSGLTTVEKQFDDQTLQTAHDKFPRGIGLKQLYRIAARANGYNQDDDEVTLGMHRAACGFNGREIRAEGFSTLSIPGILSNIANKFLQEGWGAGEMIWREITSTRSVRDFKQVTSYKLSGNLKYEKVGAGGEIKHGTVSEDSYTNQADTYGKMFAVTRTDIINDDLGAVTTIPLELGYGANDAFNEVFWTEFLDNSTFFSSGNNNLATGVISTPSTVLASLAVAEGIWMAQTKPNGTPLGMLPTLVLVPPLAKRSMLSAMASSVVVGTTGPTPATNTFSGEYRVLSSAHIEKTALYTGASTIKWYLLGNRPGFSVIETVFLNGREAPIIETAEASFSTLGMQMRGYHDFGCNKMEYRAGVQGSGA